jgi:AraC-like DNA-binding protein
LFAHNPEIGQEETAMAAGAPGLTKVRSIGPLAREVERAGGSITRVFRAAELPLGLIDEPERLFLLKDQLLLLECAAREIGDDALPARLSIGGGMACLGRYGEFASAAGDLRTAIERANGFIGALLQSATRLALEVNGERARWTYFVTDDSATGRQKNEILALGYMLDLFRRFFGPGWTPSRASVTGGFLPGGRANAETLGCNIALGAVAGLEFPAAILTAANPHPVTHSAQVPAAVGLGDASLADSARHLIGMALLDGRPSIAWLSRRLDVPQRTLQRRLAREGLTFEMLLQGVLLEQARRLLSDDALTISQIAQILGYSDHAHFTRAFAAANGTTPSAWRANRRGNRQEARIWREMAS